MGMESTATGVTIASLATTNKAAKIRFEKLAELREQLQQKHEQGTSHHGSWRSCPKLIATAFFLHGPVGSVFSRSIIFSRAMRALLFNCEVLGTLMLATLFFSASGGALSKRAPKQCGASCADEEHCTWVQVGRLIAIGVASAVLAGIPIAMLSSLHSRNIKHVRCEGCREWRRQLNAWRIQDALIWIIGVAYCLFAVNYVVLFFANVAAADQTDWFVSAGVGFLEDLIIAPIIMAVTVPLLAFMLLAALSCRHKVRKHELVMPGKIDEMLARQAERRKEEKDAMRKLGLSGDFARRVRALPAVVGDPDWEDEAAVSRSVSVAQKYSENGVRDLLQRSERRLLFAPVPSKCGASAGLIRELQGRLVLWESGKYQKLLERVEAQISNDSAAPNVPAAPILLTASHDLRSATVKEEPGSFAAPPSDGVRSRGVVSHVEELDGEHHDELDLLDEPPVRAASRSASLASAGAARGAASTSSVRAI